MGEGHDDVRIGDTERNEARALLDVHLTEGRLTIAEHEERCALAGAARVRGEVRKLFADLPKPHPEPPNAVTLNVFGRVETPASEAFGVVGVCALFVGVPAAIVMTLVEHGWWWSFLVVAAVVTAAFLASLRLEKPPPND